MNYFTNGIIYIIVPTIEITIEMENNMKSSSNTTKATARKSLDGLLTLCKLRRTISNAFNGYPWMSKTDMKIEMQKLAWQKPVDN